MVAPLLTEPRVACNNVGSKRWIEDWCGDHETDWCSKRWRAIHSLSSDVSSLSGIALFQGVGRPASSAEMGIRVYATGGTLFSS